MKWTLRAGFLHQGNHQHVISPRAVFGERQKSIRGVSQVVSVKSIDVKQAWQGLSEDHTNTTHSHPIHRLIVPIATDVVTVQEEIAGKMKERKVIQGQFLTDQPARQPASEAE
ncbi:hypothetical protein ElyMa_002155300 [Elysia marginata]|uniref:Uncharacterized protein n=1 Tax=Elysia marginata TaxID=1093978 RepID=A0AAV4FLG0_9GAST|nr:hypothetical protein ElyMa_002155300 [Elysia marginata]